MRRPLGRAREQVPGLRRFSARSRQNATIGGSVFGGLIALFAAAALGIAPARHAPAELRTSPASPAFLVVRPARSGLLLHARPGGSAIAWVGPTTDFGTQRVLGVVIRRGAWLGVTTDAVPNGELAWVRARGRTAVGVVHRAIRVSLSAHRLELLDRGRLLRSFRVGIGAPSSPTPTGRFAVAEKLPGPPLGAVYGCCVLGLSAHQPHPPARWQRNADYLVAIHGGGGIGAAGSAGCIHMADASLRYLMRNVPVGTPVFIRK